MGWCMCMVVVASLLNCLHQLRQENQRLEEHISSLTSRRDQLLAVNSRLSLPFSPVTTPPRPPVASVATGAKDQPTPSPGPGGDSSGLSTPHNRSPRAGTLNHPITLAKCKNAGLAHANPAQTTCNNEEFH
jgi:hypothetical protein